MTRGPGTLPAFLLKTVPLIFYPEINFYSETLNKNCMRKAYIKSFVPFDFDGVEAAPVGERPKISKPWVFGGGSRLTLTPTAH